MRASCIILVLAVFLTSTLAWPRDYEKSDGQENTISDILRYLLRYANGIQLINML